MSANHVSVRRRAILVSVMAAAFLLGPRGLFAQPVELPEPTQRNVIVQLFNWKFVDIEAKLPELKRLGYSHIHVSPPEKSHDGDAWYYRYQPVDFTTIDGPLGDLAAFKHLNDSADQAGMKIIVDVVFNHMANDADHANLNFPPEFGPNDFHPKADIDFNDVNSVRTGWLGGLPDLKTETDYVRSQAKAYLQMLIGLGVDGFRFDAAKHIEPGFFDVVLKDIPSDDFCFGEYISDTPAPMWEYIAASHDKLDFYDYPLLKTMQTAFGPYDANSGSGDLRSLRDPASSNHALPGPNAVTMVRDHDTDRDHVTGGGEGIKGYWVNDDDVDLAYAFILGREDGTPYVFVDMPGEQPQDDKYDRPMVVAGVRFHDLCLADPADPSNTRRAEQWLIEEPNMIAVRRGDDRLFAINKSTDDSPRPSLAAGLRDGTYVELLTKQTLAVVGGKLPADWMMPKRSAVFLVRLDH